MVKDKRDKQGVTITPDRDIRPGYDEAKMQSSSEQYEVTPGYVQELERYVPKCAIPNTDISTVKALHQLISKPKRGKDIKTFADLPPDVQEVIHN